MTAEVTTSAAIVIPATTAAQNQRNGNCKDQKKTNTGNNAHSLSPHVDCGESLT